MNTSQKNWIITTEQGCSTRNMHGFIRIRVGETIVIGHTHKEFSELFQFNESVAKRHVSVTNRKGDLIITPLVFDRLTQVVRHDDLDYREQLERGRYKTLLGIKKIYGQAIIPLDIDNALRTIKALNRVLQEEAFRPLNTKGNPGGLVEIPNDTTPVLVGDLHAQVNNLLKILSENCLLDCLRMKTATLIILGDAVHSEMADEMTIFDTSMLMMDLIFRLKLTFPGNVFYIKGNHDSFAPEINKNGNLQGELFKEFLLKTRGEEYVQEMQIFYDQLPFIILSESFIACHAGPPHAIITRDDLINIYNSNNLANELTNTRLNRPHYFSGYTKGDVKKLRKSLNLAAKTRFIVGHTPMDPFGSFWLHAGNIKNHHIIYSAHSEGPSLFIRTGESFSPITFPAEPLIDIINDLI